MGLFARKDKAAPGDPEPLPPGMFLYANKRTMVGTSPETVGPGEFPRYVYWETPDSPQDSGWRVFLGSETQADADDSSNFQINAVETLTTYHPALRQIIALGSRGAWEWSDEKGSYIETHD